MVEYKKSDESVKEGKGMNHQEIRSVILKRLYGYEQNGRYFNAEDWKNLGFISEQINFNAKYLSEKGLIEIGESLPDATNPNEPFLYYGKITAYGIDVVENSETKRNALSQPIYIEHIEGDPIITGINNGTIINRKIKEK